MKAKTVTKKSTKKKVKKQELSAKDRIKPRGFVGCLKGRIKIIGDIDNAFNNYIV